MKFSIHALKRGTVRLSAAFIIVAYQTISPVFAIAEEQRLQNPEYREFLRLVQQYKRQDLLVRLGLGSYAHRQYLSTKALNHPGNIDKINEANLGQVGCAPGEGGFPIQAQGCHAAAREEDCSGGNGLQKNGFRGLKM